MANKTVPSSDQSGADARTLLDGIPDPQKREDCRALTALMREVTGENPVLWGSSIVGFGSYHYRYASGREGDTATVAFSPRRDAISLYGLLDEGDEGALARLGKHKVGKGCLYVKRLSDVDLDVLRAMIAAAYAAKQQA